MGILQVLDEDQGYLKAGLLGLTSSGKTYTAMLLAVATRNHFKLDGPIAMFDTEGGSQYLKQQVRQLTGKSMMGVRARSFEKLLEFGRECEASGVSVAIVDSIAHPWEELKESFKADVNKARTAKGWSQRDLEFQDWGKIKPMWAKWTEFYLNSKLNIIVCGRAGDIYEMEKNEETGRKELNVVGTRMQTEKNFGYEPSLLVEMSREQILEPHTHFVRRATVWKDRFGYIDSQICDFPGVDVKDTKRLEKELAAVWAFLGRHVKQIHYGAKSMIDVGSKTETGADEAMDDGWARERKARTILAEEIEGEMVEAFPGMTAEAKKAKAGLIFEVFRTRSWTAVENMDSTKLRAGLERVRWLLHPELREKQPTQQELGPVLPSPAQAEAPTTTTDAPTSQAGEALPLTGDRFATPEEWVEFRQIIKAPCFTKEDLNALEEWLPKKKSNGEFSAKRIELQMAVDRWKAKDTAESG